MAKDKWAKRCADSSSHKHKEFVPAICKNSVKHRLLLIKLTTRRGLSKFLQLKSGHCMLNGHNNKKDFEISPLQWGMPSERDTFTLYFRVQ